MAYWPFTTKRGKKSCSWRRKPNDRSNKHLSSSFEYSLDKIQIKILECGELADKIIDHPAFAISFVNKYSIYSERNTFEVRMQEIFGF